MGTSQSAGPVPGHYQLLGIPRSASRADIAHAYRRQALAMHPDSRPQDTAATARFSALADAYKVLSDPARRADYDRALAHSQAPETDRRPGPRLSAQPGPATGMAMLWPIQAAGPVPGMVTPSVRMPGAMLWPGPVRIEPPAAPARREEQARLVALAELLSRYLDGRWEPS